MFGAAVLFGIFSGIIQFLFYFLGVLCFIKYLRE
jgi:hypothetical protein